MKPKLTGRVVPRSQVDPATIDRLYELFDRYYQRVDRATFERDHDEKDWILLLSDGNGVVQGFTTLMLYDLAVAGRRVRAVFNGNTIIDQSHWGDQELVRTWCRFMAELKAEQPEVPVYWYLISSGYRTYLFLPLFYNRFYPSCEQSTPPFEQALIDTLGRMKYPEEYRNGVIHVNVPRECLDSEIAIPAPHKLENPHVRFFVEKNAGYLRGDELVCVAEYSVENTKRMAHAIAVEVLGASEVAAA